ncbi:MerR family transcriptional regulator [Kocuria sp. SM24M-10]|nr:MerR family transcriptional regulator [Kocuria sp. SM24M-10]
MRIGELSRVSGVSARALPYYEEQGLLVPERASNGYREYAEDAPVIVAQIQGMFSFGLNSETIRRYLPCARGSEPRLQMCADLRAHLQQRREELERHTAQLLAQRKVSRRVRQIPSGGLYEGLL